MQYKKYTTVNYIIIHYRTVNYIPVHYITVNYITVNYRSVYYRTVNYRTVHYRIVNYRSVWHCENLVRQAPWCNFLSSSKCTLLYQTALHYNYTALHITAHHSTTYHCTTYHCTAHHDIVHHFTAHHCILLHSTAVTALYFLSNSSPAPPLSCSHISDSQTMDLSGINCRLLDV